MTAASEALESAAPSREHPGGRTPPLLSGGWPLLGHLLDLRRRPIELFRRVRDECGEIGEMNWAGNRVVLLTGEAAQEAFFRADGGAARSGRGVSVHDADLRARRGVRRHARAAPPGDAQPVAARQDDAQPRGDDRDARRGA